MRSFLFSCLCLFQSFCNAQSDTSFVESSLSNIIRLYEISVKSQHRDFNGTAYTELKRTKTEHPYYLVDEWVTGSIDYEGRHFNNVPLRFELVNNTLVTKAYNDEMLALVKEKLDGFGLKGHHFVKINNEDVNNSLPGTGYYDVIYDGPSRVIASHQKDMQRTMVNQVYTYNLDTGQKLYLEKNRYFILMKGRYYPVSGKSSVLGLFNNQKTTLKKFIRQQGLDFKQDRDKSLSAVAAFYDSLMK
jgi:hypothetical protein